MLELRVLGAVRVLVDGRPVAVSAPRQRALLARLAIADGRAVPLPRLIADLWGERAPDSAVNSLQVMVSSLRKLLGASAIRTAGRAYALAEDAAVDAAAFRSELRAGMTALDSGDDAGASAWLTRAVQRWSGEAFQDVESVEVLEADRVALADLRVDGIEALAGVRIRLGHAADVVRELGPLIAEHPHREGLRARLVMALAASGRQVDALAAYDSARSWLVEEYGVDPGPELQAAHAAVLRNELPTPILVRRSPLRLGLPETPGRLIGRHQEVNELNRMVADPTIRLITILGTGGVGKTRLAQELVAHAEVDASFVTLLPAERADDVAGVIASSLGLNSAGESLVDSVVTGLINHGCELLVVLDNFEHVLAAAPMIDQMLREVPGLSVVATSRSPLGLSLEQRYPLDPLPVVADTPEGSVASTLLLDRVRRIDPRFRASEDDLRDAEAIAELCDGLPLAIEIAAARTLVFGLRELRELLTHPLTVLVAGPGGDKRSSVRASIQWSIDALPAGVVTTLQAATVFRGGFTRAALSAVIDLDAEMVAQHLQLLVEHSLVRTVNAGVQRRFDLLQVIREVVAEDFDENEHLALRDRHALYYRQFLGPQPYARHHPTTRAGLELIAAERPNLRAAVRHAATRSTDLLADLVVSLSYAWMMLESSEELCPWLENLLSRPDLDEGRRVDCLISLARARGGMGAGERKLLEDARSLPAGRDGGHRAIIVSFMIAQISAFLDDPAGAAATLAGMRDQVAATDDPLLTCQHLMLTGLADAANDRFDTATARFREAARLADGHGLENVAMICNTNLSEALIYTGSAAEAAETAAQVIARAHPDDHYRRAGAHSGRGMALMLLGRYDEARLELLTALAESTSTGQTWDGLESLMRLAAVIAATDPSSTWPGFLLGMWSAGSVDLGIPPQAGELQTIGQYLGEYRDAPTATRFGDAREDGAARVSSLGSSKALRVTIDEVLTAARAGLL